MDNRPGILIICHDVDVVGEAQAVYVLQEGCLVSTDNYAALCQKQSVPELVAE